MAQQRLAPRLLPRCYHVSPQPSAVRFVGSTTAEDAYDHVAPRTALESGAPIAYFMGMTRNEGLRPPGAGRATAAFALLAATWLWVPAEVSVKALWPSVVAIAGVFLLRRVLAGLLLGGLAGALLLESGNPGAAILPPSGTTSRRRWRARGT